MNDRFNTPKTEESTTVWITPKHIIDAVGSFDLDPCANEIMPWPTARYMNTRSMCDGLTMMWPERSRVWLNPPYGEGMWRWLEKLAQHGTGTALIFARSDTEGYHKYVLAKAHSILFIKGRVKFFNERGCMPKNSKTGKTNSPNAPSVLVSYSAPDTLKLKQAVMFGDIKGAVWERGL